MDGILIVNKPVGCTSHDVVEIVRRRFAIRRVGHAGTLDPMAEGVLVLLLGRVTRLAEFMNTHDKVYRAGLLLGLSTDTQDTTGKVTSETSANEIGSEELQATFKQFTGKIKQIPPMYSAVKIGGERLYRMAREGKQVERKPRSVTIYELLLEDFQPGERARATIYCKTSSGTYVRTLCSDIGDALGVGGCMETLCRIASGPFLLQDSIALIDLEKLSSQGLQQIVLPPATAVDSLPRIDVDSEDARLFCCGGAIHNSEVSHSQSATSTIVRVHSSNGALLGVGQVDEAAAIKPLKVISDV